jgi:hypothetical protein
MQRGRTRETTADRRAAAGPSDSAPHPRPLRRLHRLQLLRRRDRVTLDVERTEDVAEEDAGGVIAVLPGGAVDPLVDSDEALLGLRREVLQSQFEAAFVGSGNSDPAIPGILSLSSV